MPRRNYQVELDQIISHLSPSNVPRLLLHCCCAPCSSYVLSYLSIHFNITVFFYNPNIAPLAEYEQRKNELLRFIAQFPASHTIETIDADYCPEQFFKLIRGLENEPEGGKRCERCFKLRLEETARLASQQGFDYFTTTLSISPLKNADLLNEIGESLAQQYAVRYLPSDFKKRDGYKQSIVLSRKYQLYRQNYCGCIFSKKAAHSIT